MDKEESTKEWVWIGKEGIIRKEKERMPIRKQRIRRERKKLV